MAKLVTTMWMSAPFRVPASTVGCAWTSRAATSARVSSGTLGTGASYRCVRNVPHLKFGLYENYLTFLALFLLFPTLEFVDFEVFLCFSLEVFSSCVDK